MGRNPYESSFQNNKFKVQWYHTSVLLQKDPHKSRKLLHENIITSNFIRQYLSYFQYTKQSKNLYQELVTECMHIVFTYVFRQ